MHCLSVHNSFRMLNFHMRYILINMFLIFGKSKIHLAFIGHKARCTVSRSKFKINLKNIRNFSFHRFRHNLTPIFPDRFKLKARYDIPLGFTLLLHLIYYRLTSPTINRVPFSLLISTNISPHPHMQCI